MAQSGKKEKCSDFCGLLLLENILQKCIRQRLPQLKVWIENFSGNEFIAGFSVWNTGESVDFDRNIVGEEIRIDRIEVFHGTILASDCKKGRRIDHALIIKGFACKAGTVNTEKCVGCGIDCIQSIRVIIRKCLSDSLRSGEVPD